MIHPFDERTRMSAALEKVCKEALELPLDQRVTLVNRILEQSDESLHSMPVENALGDLVQEQATHYVCGNDASSAVKKSAMQVVEKLSDGCSWDDLMYELYVRQKIDQGLDDLEKGRVVSHDEVRRMMLS
jgi:predicted transcriptional regulator